MHVRTYVCMYVCMLPTVAHSKAHLSLYHPTYLPTYLVRRNSAPAGLIDELNGIASDVDVDQARVLGK